MSTKMVKSIWEDDDIEYLLSPSVGNSGGLISLWKSSLFQLSTNHITRHWIGIVGLITSKNFNCILINIYNPCTIEDRSKVWIEIMEYVHCHQKPCLITGDFNEVLSINDRGSQQASTQGINDFQAFINNLELVEISASNGKYTWFRGQSKSTLDRLFIQPEWIHMFPALKVSLLHRSLSDHCPLLICSTNQNWGAKPFRFLNCWLTHPQCMKKIKSAWSKVEKLLVPQKLRVVREDLKQWNIFEFGSIDFNIKSLEEKINHFDNIANNRLLLANELQERRKAQLDLWAWQRRRESYWAQLSRARWIREGDKNTRFFHTLASMRRRKNQIEKLVIEGVPITNPTDIKEEAVAYFQNAFKEEHKTRPTFEKLNFKQISSDESEFLTAPFTHEEVDAAVASCDSQKAPGPDGFNFSFIKSAWDVIKTDIYGIVNEFGLRHISPEGVTVHL